MTTGSSAPAPAELPRHRQAERTGIVLKVMIGLEVIVVAFAFLEPGNDPLLTAVFHGPSLALLSTGLVLHRRDRPRAAGWIVATEFWVVVAAATWLFGGLQFEMGSAFVVSVMVAAATLGSRPALLFGALSVGWATLITAADLNGRLPPSIGPASAINGWISLTMSISIAAILVHMIMRDLQQAIAGAAQANEERNMARIQLLQAQRLEPMGRLAAGIAHDFNNLLTAFTALSELMREASDPAVRGELADEHAETARRAEQMTAQLLAFGKQEAGEPELIDLARLTGELSPILTRLIGDRIALTVAVEGPTPVRAIPGQLEQVIFNLAINARDAMPDGGKLTLSCERRGDDVLLVVEDSGMGMDPETVKDAFAPFFTTKRSGTGLGLATVTDIIHSCAGSIHLRTEPGRGTRFEIKLPAQEAPAADRGPPSSAVADSAPSGQVGSILLADDDHLVRRTVRRLLEREGFTVTTVGDGEEALAAVLAGDSAFDLIVSDLKMPRRDGAELVQELHRRGFTAPVLLISGHVEDLPAAVAEVAFPVRLLRKPFTNDDLLPLARELLATRAAAHPPAGSEGSGEAAA